MSPINPVDHKTFFSASNDRLAIVLVSRVPFGHLVEQVGMLDIHYDVLGIVDLLFERNAEVSLEDCADSPRQRTALDQLSRVANLQDCRAGNRFEPGTLRQPNPGA